MRRLQIELPDDVFEFVCDWAFDEDRAVKEQMTWIIRRAVARRRARTPTAT